MSEIHSLRDHRERIGRPTRSYSIEINAYGPDDPPEIIIRGLGNDVADIDFRALVRDLIRIPMIIAPTDEEVKAKFEATATASESPVAFASIWTDGSVSTFVDLARMDCVARRDWLLRALELVPVSFGDLLASAPLEPAGLPTANDPS